MDPFELHGVSNSRFTRGLTCGDNITGKILVSATTSAKRPSGVQLNADELGAWRGFLRVHSKLTRELDAELAAAHGLPLSSYEVLLFLADAPNGQLRMAQLADSVLLSPSGLTRLVDRLEKAGLVRRESCPADRRGFEAVITDDGRAALAEARPTHLSGVRRRFLEHFSTDEMRTLSAYWDRVLQGPADDAD
jgi:DNA-binding MarR family transcriptional regulator